MEPSSLKSSILSMLEPAPERFQGRVREPASLSDKIQEISSFLAKHPELKEDLELVGRLLEVTSKSRGRTVQKFRKELILDSCCKIENKIMTVIFHDFIPDREKAMIMHSCPSNLGRFNAQKKTLTFTKEAIEQVDDDQFWEFIESQGVKKLVVDQATYEGNVLQRLIQKKPGVQAFTETYTIKFADEKELLGEVKAKLLLLGDFFEGMLKHNLKKAQEKVIDLAPLGVTLNQFDGILQEVETGKSDPRVPDELRSYFNPEVFPQGVIGPACCEKVLGREITDVPPIPKGYIEKAEEIMGRLVLMPKDLSLDEAKERAIAIGLPETYINSEIQKRDGKNKIEEPYWYVITDGLIPESEKYNTVSAYKKCASDHGLEAPSSLEQLWLLITHYESTKDETGKG